MPFPFTHANGGPCCTSPKDLCPTCEGKLAVEKHNMRSAEDYTPPDPYKAGTDAQRASDAMAAAKRTYQPAPRPTEMHLDAHGVPDSYFHAIEAMKQENR